MSRFLTNLKHNLDEQFAGFEMKQIVPVLRENKEGYHGTATRIATYIGLPFAILSGIGAMITTATVLSPFSILAMSAAGGVIARKVGEHGSKNSRTAKGMLAGGLLPFIVGGLSTLIGFRTVGVGIDIVLKAGAAVVKAGAESFGKESAPVEAAAPSIVPDTATPSRLRSLSVSNDFEGNAKKQAAAPSSGNLTYLTPSAPTYITEAPTYLTPKPLTYLTPTR